MDTETEDNAVRKLYPWLRLRNGTCCHEHAPVKGSLNLLHRALGPLDNVPLGTSPLLCVILLFRLVSTVVG